MLTIGIELLRGRYHATPWGRHVNEGVPEWPPAPFRLARTLFDAWKRKRPTWGPERVEPILRAIAFEDPLYALPEARQSHVRVFYRQGGESEADKKLVFDSFVVVEPGAVVRMGWPSLSLSAEVGADLDELLAVVGYLGRAESLASLSRLSAHDEVDWNCRPLAAARSTPRAELVRVAGLAPPDQHVSVAMRSPRSAKRGKGDVPSLAWLDSLTWGTVEVQAHGLSDPPALRWVTYCRASDALDVRSTGRARVSHDRVETILLSLDGKVRPAVETTVSVAEEVRRRAMGAHKRLVGDPGKLSRLLSGKDEQGRPARGHLHAYFLPWDRDADGRLDHIVVRVRGGLDSREVAAFDRVRVLSGANPAHPVAVVPIAAGAAGILPPTRCFRSATPFVPTRHHKPKREPDHAEWLAGQIELELERHGLPRLAKAPVVMANDERVAGRPRRWLEYQRSRRGEAPRMGHGFRIELVEPVHGPFAIGQGAHFGLGLFVPDEGNIRRVDEEGDDLDAEERAALEAHLSEAWKSIQAGNVRPADELLAELRARR